jgi:hypothetical protein
MVVLDGKETVRENNLSQFRMPREVGQDVVALEVHLDGPD